MIHASVPPLEIDLSRHALRVDDSRFGFDADLERRSPDHRIPRATIAFDRERNLGLPRQHAGNDLAEPREQPNVSCVAEWIATGICAHGELQPDDCRHSSEFRDGGIGEVRVLDPADSRVREARRAPDESLAEPRPSTRAPQLIARRGEQPPRISRSNVARPVPRRHERQDELGLLSVASFLVVHQTGKPSSLAVPRRPFAHRMHNARTRHRSPAHSVHAMGEIGRAGRKSGPLDHLMHSAALRTLRRP
jgi:hypothetical protein